MSEEKTMDRYDDTVVQVPVTTVVISTDLSINIKTTYLRIVETGCLSLVENTWSSAVVDVGDSESAVEALLRRMLSFR